MIADGECRVAAVGPLVDLGSPVEDSVTPRRGTMLLTEKQYQNKIFTYTSVDHANMLPWQKWLLYSIQGLVAKVEDTVANGLKFG